MDSFVIGWIAVLIAVIGFGSYAVPIKDQAANSVDVDPLVMQSYKSLMCFVTSRLVSRLASCGTIVLIVPVLQGQTGVVWLSYQGQTAFAWTINPMTRRSTLVPSDRIKCEGYPALTSSRSENQTKGIIEVG